MRNIIVAANIFGKCVIMVCLLAVTGCSSSKKINQDFLYFQKSLDSIQNIQRVSPVIKVDDVLGIQVFSKSMNQDQASIFNIPAGDANNGNQGYVVGSNGNIDMAVIGAVKAAGLTKEQLQTILREKISSYVKDPSVLIRFSDFKINVLGEVKMPGSHVFNKDRVTIIDAISSAGDLTDFGKRDDIIVIREESNQRKYYNIDLRSGTLFQSPVYQLQPNDIVYVNATERKLKSLNVNPEGQRGWQLFFGIVSVVSTIAALAITISKN
ncbi:MAG: polysaccharide biosynthesis/export family protein [Bacteroidota bacterium]